MGTRSQRFVARAEKSVGWRIWDNVLHRYWGPVFPQQPTPVVAELNGEKRGPQFDRLVAQAKRLSR